MAQWGTLLGFVARSAGTWYQIRVSSLPARTLACICLTAALGQQVFSEEHIRQVLEKLREAQPDKGSNRKPYRAESISCTLPWLASDTATGRRKVEEEKNLESLHGIW